jgi:hypothetical protein
MVSLDTVTRQEFTRVIGYEPPSEFFARLEEILGKFCGIQKFVKTMPRRAEIKAALEYLSKETKEVLRNSEGPRQLFTQPREGSAFPVGIFRDYSVEFVKGRDKSATEGRASAGFPRSCSGWRIS